MRTSIFAYLTRIQIASGELNSIKIQIISWLTPGWLHEWIFNEWESFALISDGVFHKLDELRNQSSLSGLPTDLTGEKS